MHWDIGLYITGKNIYIIEDQRNGEKNFLIDGISVPDGKCISNLSCVVVEFGATTMTTSSGFASSFIAAHQT